jgi:peptidoglycan lytic transglycosylase B
MKFLVHLIVLLSLGAPAFAKTKHKSKSPLQADPVWVEKELTRLGLSQAYVAESMKYYEPGSFDSTVTLNLLGFLRPAGEHMNRVNAEAVRETQSFVRQNQSFFALAEQTYNVPPHVISALLWIETRHGDNMGKFHINSVYLHLLQANQNKNRVLLTKLAFEKNKKEQRFTKKALRRLMAERTKKKAAWAREQILAMAAIRKKKHLDITTLRGSYAGAFGLSQFIPTSYLEYAKPAKRGTVAKLTEAPDAIMSVAYYLHRSGWKNENPDSQIDALMKYNNSRDYADSILEISKQVVAANTTTASKNRGVSSVKDK